MKFHEKVLEELKEATKMKQEICGYLLCKNISGELVALGYFVTGKGTPGRVVDDEKRLREFERYRRGIEKQYGKVIAIPFHTHSKGTIETYGKRYVNYPSGGDLETMIKSQWEEIVIFTPAGVLDVKRTGQRNFRIDRSTYQKSVYRG